jgi:hypothetical protein
MRRLQRVVLLVTERGRAPLREGTAKRPADPEQPSARPRVLAAVPELLLPVVQFVCCRCGLALDGRDEYCPQCANAGNTQWRKL